MYSVLMQAQLSRTDLQMLLCALKGDSPPPPLSQLPVFLVSRLISVRGVDMCMWQVISVLTVFKCDTIK